MRPHRSILLALLPLSSSLACESVSSPPPRELDLWADAAAGVENLSLASLCSDFWDERLKSDPFRATVLGDPRFLDDVPHASFSARQARADRLEALQQRARGLDASLLSESDRVTHDLLLQELESDIALLELGLVEWAVDPVEGPHTRMLNICSVQPVETARERDDLVERWNAFASYIREAGANLRSGRNQGKVASRTAVAKTIEQVDRILATDPFESPLVVIATGGGKWVPFPADANVAEVAHEHLGDARNARDLRLVNLHLQEGERLAVGTKVLIPAADDPLSAEERGSFLHAVIQAVEDEIYPALAGYRDLLNNEILRAARGDDRPGLCHVGGGEAAYRTLIAIHTSLPEEECDPQAIHDYGEQEVARIRSEIAALGGKVFGTSDVAEIQERLRNDPERFFASREEVQGKAVEALFAARSKMRQYFGILPEAPCEVVRIPAHEEAQTTVAYYREPAADGSRPGQYFINTSEPETRPRYEAEVLAFHEAIPGHHLQIAIAQELTDLPLFRRHGGSTAFVEGWALYTERLCDEMGLYSSDVDRFGVLSFDAWRACRLVVDSGIHAFGWTRDQAIDYLYENTLLARNNVETEVDRYIAWPGQALAYKIGQREILALRDEARAQLGSRFSYPEFHDRILENGAVTLPTLRRLISSWLAS